MSIEVKALSKSFGSFRAVDNVSFRVETGELMALLGPSGSGKSTLLRMIAGLEQPDQGEVLLTGRNPLAYRPETAMWDLCSNIMRFSNT